MLLSLNDVDLRLGGPMLLDRAALTVEPGERLALLGRNGAGKSSLLRLIAGELTPDAGQLRLESGIRIALLPQEIPTHWTGTAAGIARHQDPAGEHETPAWQTERWLTELGVDPATDFATLSGGMKRRVLLAHALAREPDLLLLDEPTNHLDPAQIEWLEDLLLQRFKGSLIFISHDRRFIRRLAGGILQLDRGRLTRWPGDLDRYLEQRDAALTVEARHDALFDKHLAAEESWIRQGVKARRTRNEGRVRALEALRRERAARRHGQGQARIALESAAPSGRLVVELEAIGHGFDEQRPLIADFSTSLMRGDKVGIVGPNGCGKTTLLRILLGELAPRRGRVRLGTRLEVAYFDQLRAVLNDDDRPVDIIGVNETYDVFYVDHLYDQYTRGLADVSTISSILVILALLMIMFGTYGSTFLILAERRREVTILRAVGFSAGNVQSILIWRTLAQLATAYLAAWGISALILDEISRVYPITVHAIPLDVIISLNTLLIGILLSLFFGLLGVWLSTLHLHRSSVQATLGR